MPGAKKDRRGQSATTPIRVAIRCSWSGARIAVPPDSSTPVTASSTVQSVLSAAASSSSGGGGGGTAALPPSIFDEGSGASVVYMRKSVPREEWGRTTLAELGVDACSGGSGVVLTLNLGGGPAVAASAVPAVASASTAAATGAASAPASAGGGAAASAAAAAAAPLVPEPMEVDHVDAVDNDAPESMEVQPTAASAAAPAVPPNSSPSAALARILSSNFDADSKPCLLTLIKILDNVLSKPGDVKVRSIRLSNPAFERKVGKVNGGVDFLVSCGFTPAPLGETIELLERNEDTAVLVEARHLLAEKAVNALGVEASSVPKFRPPPSPPAAAAAPARVVPSAGPASGGATFDPYKTHSFSSAAAAAGAPNPHSVRPTEQDDGGRYVSRTEKELERLRSKQERLERTMHKLGGDRGLVALRPGQVGPVVSLAAGAGTDGGGDPTGGGSGGAGGKGDGSLLAARMKRMEEERRKREEGGFTTKAMRDLEAMKKARVYSHAQLRICFSDGASLSAKFLPSETVRSVAEVVRSAFRPELAEGLAFDLYVAPPRRMLDLGSKLVDEGLVPAARVHVSWKVGGAPPPGGEAGAYLNDELFAAAAATGGSAAAAFPDAKKLVGDEAEGKKRRAGSDGAASAPPSKESKEEALMMRMLGKKPSLLGRKGSSASSDGGGKKKDAGGGGGGGKPRWFKG